MITRLRRPKSMWRTLSLIVILALLLPTFVSTQASVPTASKTDLDKIMDEGMHRSQVMHHLSYLTDVIGGRLTNSPSLKRANEWTRDTMATWGMQNARLEAWGPFGRGWSLTSFSAQVVAPAVSPVIAYPKAWSPSTKGSVTAEIVYLDITSDEELVKYQGQLRGKIAFVSQPRELQADFGGMGTRWTEAELAVLANAPDPATLPARRVVLPNGQPTPEIMALLRDAQKQLKAAKFALDEGAAVLVDNSTGGSGGTVFVQSAVATPPPAQPGQTTRPSFQPYVKGTEAYMLPQMTMATEDYNRIVRMIRQGEKPRMTVDIQAQYHDDDLMGYNTVADIPGTDPKLKDEIVMLGGHLDSWHAGTGATDNAAGCAVAMEAARILIASGLKPRRTVRVALWTGEEQALLGSRAYVRQQFGELRNIAPQAGAEPSSGPRQELIKGANYDKLSVYYNLDNGTGKVRGVYLQGNPAVRPIFEAWLKPFRDLGASTLTLSNTSGTDHLSFDQIGLPGFQFIQDKVEYDTRTHHSNQDNYDRIQADDMKQAATIMAAFVYQSAIMDGKMPRKAFSVPIR